MLLTARLSFDLKVRRAFARRLDRLDVRPGRWLVAVSGGADSLALLELLHGEADARRLELVVAHADHGIHADSARVAEQVAAHAARLRLPIHVRQFQLGADCTETRARSARRGWLLSLMREAGARGVFLAHHADDQAETVLMRLLHGSGPAGLAAMAERSGAFLRPLLRFRHRTLARFLDELGLEWWEDPANADPHHLRSWVRVDILPRLRRRIPDVDFALLRVARQAARARLGWERLLDHYPGLDPANERGVLSVSASALAATAPEAASELLAALARRAGTRLSRGAVGRALRLAHQGESGQRADLGAGWTGERSFDRLRLLPPGATFAPFAPLASAVFREPEGATTWGAWHLAWRREAAPTHLDRKSETTWLSSAPFEVRSPRAGERMRPLGGTGRRLLVRLFQDAHVPASDRRSWPLIVVDGEPVWLPSVCRADTHLPRPGEETIRIDVRSARG